MIQLPAAPTKHMFNTLSQMWEIHEINEQD